MAIKHLLHPQKQEGKGISCLLQHYRNLDRNVSAGKMPCPAILGYFSEHGSLICCEYSQDVSKFGTDVRRRTCKANFASCELGSITELKYRNTEHKLVFCSVLLANKFDNFFIKVSRKNEFMFSTSVLLFITSVL